MKAFRFRLAVGVLTAICVLLFGIAIAPTLAAKTPSKPVKPATGTPAAKNPQGSTLDVVVKINRLEDALRVVDQL